MPPNISVKRTAFRRRLPRALGTQMSQVLVGAALVAFVALWTIGVIAWFAILVFGFKAVRRTRAGVNRWGGETMGNPANVLFRPSLLTPEGLRYRRKCFFAVGTFITAVAVGLLFGALTGQLK